MNDSATDWEAMWARGLPRGAAFDGNGASPGLTAHLARFHAPDGAPSEGARARSDECVKRALVPGAGRSYDAVALAEAGFKVDAWDIAPTAVERALELVGESASHARQHVHVACRDFFEARDEDPLYDFVWDCTFLCAISKSMRQKWAERHASLVKPGGQLVSLVFPILPDTHPKVLSGSGPPFALNVSIVRGLLEPHGFVLKEAESQFVLPESEQHLPGKMPDVKTGLLVFVKE